jgi:hypothetical protein
MLFEGFPIWLWSKIDLREQDEGRLKEEHPTAWTFAHKKFKIVQVESLLELHDADLWFVSGSMLFRDSLSMITGPVVMWMATGGRRRPRNEENGVSGNGSRYPTQELEEQQHRWVRLEPMIWARLVFLLTPSREPSGTL